MDNYPSHREDLLALRRVEGQVRGLQKMIEDQKYCVDILTQVHAVVGALLRVQDHILRRHIEHCVAAACQEGTALEKQKKVEEVLELIKKFRKY